MKNCFEGVVGLRELDSNCVYWANDMVGITTELAQHLQTYDNDGLREFWEMIKQRAWLKFLANFTISFHTFYASCCKDRQEIESYMQNLICNNKTVLTLAWLNLICLELITEKIYSNRINYFTTTNLDDTRMLRDYYQSEFDKNFTNGIKSIYVPEEMKTEKTGFCFIQTSYMIP